MLLLIIDIARLYCMNCYDETRIGYMRNDDNWGDRERWAPSTKP